MTDQGTQPKRNAFVSAEQLAALMDFLELYPELAFGRCNRTTEGRSKAQRLWQECADILNGITANCHRKEAKDWRTFYSEFKSKVLKKVKEKKTELCKTGGGKARDIILTPLQDRLYTLLGRDVGDPLPGVQQNPLVAPGRIEHESDALIIDPSPDLHSGHSSQYVRIFNDSIIDDQIVLSFEDVEQREQSTEMVVDPTPTSPAGPSAEPNSSQVASTSNRPVRSSHSQLSLDREPTRTRANQEQPRRRRQRRGAESQPSNLEAAEGRLTEVEKASAEATLEHARATHRLASAVDKLAENMAQLSVSVTNALREIRRSPTKERHRRPHSPLIVDYDSESE